MSAKPAGHPFDTWISLAPEYSLDPKDGWKTGNVTMLKGPLAVTKECIWRGLAFEDMPGRVQEYVGEGVKKFNPDKVFICDGSDIQKRYLIGAHPSIKKLNKYHEVYAVQTDPGDVARVESKTFISTWIKSNCVPQTKQGVKGVLGMYMEPDVLAGELAERQTNCMVGQTMFVIPFSMGPIGSELSKYGVELTDSIYVTLCMTIMTRVGKDVFKALGENKFVRCMHSVGVPNPPKVHRGMFGKEAWPCNPPKTIISHFPEKSEINSYGSGYGGNSLLGKKCFALRIAMNLARDEGWLAEHMLIMGITPPSQKKPMYITAAFPSACGKTNMAMLEPTLPGWKVTCVGDDIAWMRFNDKHELRAINPEAGFFGVAPGTSMHTNPQAMKCCNANSIHTNVAMTSDGGFFWDGMEDSDLFDAETMKDPAKLEAARNNLVLTSWLGVERKYVDYLADLKGAKNKAEKDEIKKKMAHPNSRFCTPASGCQIIDPLWEDVRGVPVEAMIFGGRRPTGIPLIYQAYNWAHGVAIGAQLKSEATAAAEHTAKVVMHDPMAMRPFFGYNFGLYLNHWLGMEPLHDKKDIGGGKHSRLPQIFHVNWFRLDDKGDFLWPGFGENIRVIDWVIKRVRGEIGAIEGPLGWMPEPPRAEGDYSNSLNMSGLNCDYNKMYSLDKNLLLEDIKETLNWFDEQAGPDMPKVILNEFDKMIQRIQAMK